MGERMAAWLKARKTRVTVDDAYVEARTAMRKRHGIFFGVVVEPRRWRVSWPCESHSDS
jgi:hypothetical protein